MLSRILPTLRVRASICWAWRRAPQGHMSRAKPKQNDLPSIGRDFGNRAVADRAVAVCVNGKLLARSQTLSIINCT